MLPEKDSEYEKIVYTLADRGNRIREKLRGVIISGVHNSELLKILNEISLDWKDMFRPALTSLSCEAVGGNPAEAEAAGIVFTLASAGFAIHDDIIDNSAHKHFRTTFLGRFGNNSALLVGDLLIVKAWTFVQEIITKSKNPAKLASIFRTYGDLNVEICEAEFMDALCKKKLDVSLNYRKKILWKAMAESEACTRIGAALGNGSKEEVEALAKFGRCLGFNYRLASEVRDVINIEGNLPDRIRHESLPLPLLYAAKSSKGRNKKIKFIIEKSKITASNIRELVEICLQSGAFTYMLKLAREAEAEAQRNLSLLKPSNSVRILSLLVARSYELIKVLPC